MHERPTLRLRGQFTAASIKRVVSPKGAVGCLQYFRLSSVDVAAGEALKSLGSRGPRTVHHRVICHTSGAVAHECSGLGDFFDLEDVDRVVCHRVRHRHFQNACTDSSAEAIYSIRLPDLAALSTGISVLVLNVSTLPKFR